MGGIVYGVHASTMAEHCATRSEAALALMEAEHLWHDGRRDDAKRVLRSTAPDGGACLAYAAFWWHSSSSSPPSQQDSVAVQSTDSMPEDRRLWRDEEEALYWLQRGSEAGNTRADVIMLSLVSACGSKRKRNTKRESNTALYVGAGVACIGVLALLYALWPGTERTEADG